jgi:hypothetical protein
MTILNKPVTRIVDLGRGPVAVTLTTAGDVPVIRFREKGRRKTFDLPLAAAFVEAVGRSVKGGKQ